jgi:hypothetical protein
MPPSISHSPSRSLRTCERVHHSDTWPKAAACSVQVGGQSFVRLARTVP